MLGNITSANATLVLTVDSLFPAGITLEQFGTDQSFSGGTITLAETRMGVDGQLVAGYVPAIKEVTITLEASSPSYASLVTLYRASEKAKGFYQCSLVASLPSIGKTYSWTNGILVEGTPVPEGGKTLQATTWKFAFETLTVQG